MRRPARSGLDRGVSHHDRADERYGVPFSPHIIGVLSLVILAIAIIALYIKHLAGAARWIYIVTAILALYLNAFVAVVQAFQKIAFLRPLAPTQKQPPFMVAQLLVLAFFVATALKALKSFPARTIRSVV